MLIQLEQISKVYRAGQVDVHALAGVSLQIERGEFVAIVGQSGSGKTTLLDIIGCLSRPTKGTYRLNGTAVSTLPDTDLTTIRNRRIGFVFQTFHLLPRKTALENVELPLLYAGFSRDKQRARAKAILEQVGLHDRMAHYTNQMSGGQQQRVAIARALVNTPDILLADEPTGNLDSRSGHDILEIFHQLHKNGQTIIMITHDHQIAGEANRRIALADGLLIADDRTTIVNEAIRSSG